MTFLSNYLEHASAIGRAAEHFGHKASTRHPDFCLVLERHGQTRVWLPKFFVISGDRILYTHIFSDRVVGFAGWMPYPLRQWPIALDKIAFKRYAIEHGIPTPAACFDPSLIRGPFIIKHAHSSFGEGIRGPFLIYDAKEPTQQLLEGEYYENFIVGLIAKAWYWGTELVALHFHKPSIVTGDGSSTVRELVLRLPNFRKKNDWELILRLARYGGVRSLEEVVREAKQVLVEFRYGSRYEVAGRGNPNVLKRADELAPVAQFKTASELASATSPEAEGAPVLYTLDAIVDEAGEVFFLEMNCNPVVHPDCYDSMLRALGM